jgi:MFS family permease
MSEKASDQSETERTSALGALRHQTFRTIWSANLVSSFGALIQGVGAAWLMTSITDSVDMVALVQSATTLPIMMFSLVGGAVADNFNRRRVMLTAQLFMFAISIALAAGAFFGLITPWVLLAFTFLLGCGVALNNPSWQASVGDLVPRSDLPGAVALNSIGFNLSRSLGPAVGGIIVAVAGAAGAFAANAASYLALLFVLVFRWKSQPAASTLPRETLGSAMVAGLRYVAMSPDIGKVLVRSFIFGFAAISVLALLPVVANTRVGGGPLVYGLLLGAFGVGAVGGALLSGRLRKFLSSEAIVRLALVGFSICAWLLALSSSPWLSGAALALGGACWVLALALFNVTVQLASPRWVVGRTLSLYQTATFGGMALGSWIWGLAGEVYGVQIALIVSSVVMLLGAALGLWVRLPPHVTESLDPLNRFKEPHLELDLQPRSGPIVIEIEYQIAPEDLDEFLQVMSDRKRIRRRDGARHWTLMRDLAHPDLWIENYRSPTWTEYIRHNLRLTHADAAISERLRALHQGPESPRVRRMIERPPTWFATSHSKGTIDPH